MDRQFKIILIQQVRTSAKAFTLTELLVVIGIITLLLSLLLPAANLARSSVRELQCANNMRQLCMALLAYSNDNEGRFPPNTSSSIPGQYWCSESAIGRYSPYGVTWSSTVGGGIFVCPSDVDAQRSYAMNIWASCKVDSSVSKKIPAQGVLWASNVAASSKMILLVETWSYQGSNAVGWFAPGAVGSSGTTAGQRFGAGGGISPLINTNRWGRVNCELAYMRHRKGFGSSTSPSGRVNLGYADGHVATKSNQDLADSNTGRSTLDSLWAPNDY